MRIDRIAKTGGALLGGQGLLLATQLLLPPLFLRRYGVSAYGEWLTLSAAAQYLGTLNFGLQSFANNQVSIHYNRGELHKANAIQATTVVILLAVVAALAVITSVIFLLPVSGLLHLKTSPLEASLTIYLLGLSVLVKMIFGFLQGSFLIIGAAHRGTNWGNALGLMSLIGTTVLVLHRANFVAIAALTLLLIIAFSFLVLVDLRFTAPVAFPKLRYACRSRIEEIIRPSGYFGMLFSATFLAYQLPVVIMQRILGPTSVVVFSITRTIFSMSRQALTSVSAAIGPEIVELYGRNDWPNLLRLYAVSERVVFALIPVVSLGTFFATPILISIWVHRPELYQPEVCLFMAVISAQAGIKEHKYQFQTSVNQHSSMAKFVFLSYVLMVFLMVPGVLLYGIRGFLLLWLTTELAQTSFIVRLNQILFAESAKLDLTPILKLAALLLVATGVCACLVTELDRQSLLNIAGISLVSTAILTLISYRLFGVSALKTNFFARLIR